MHFLRETYLSVHEKEMHPSPRLEFFLRKIAIHVHEVLIAVFPTIMSATRIHILSVLR